MCTCVHACVHFIMHRPTEKGKQMVACQDLHERIIMISRFSFNKVITADESCASLMIWKWRAKCGVVGPNLLRKESLFPKNHEWRHFCLVFLTLGQILNLAFYTGVKCILLKWIENCPDLQCKQWFILASQQYASHIARVICQMLALWILARFGICRLLCISKAERTVIGRYHNNLI